MTRSRTAPPAAPAAGEAPGTPGPAGRGRVSAAVGVLGELMVTAGVVVLLFVVYELWVTGLFTARDQRQLQSQLAEQWRQPAPPPASPSPVVESVPLGDAVAVIRAPRLGEHWHWVIDEGVDEGELAKGPGHYPGTALPGQVGNFVVSGHRTTHGAPFYSVDSLQAGDAVVIETRDTWYVYRVSREIIVDPGDIGVTYPVPERPGQPPTGRLVTLTTCNPRYSASQRLIVQGELAASQPKSAGPPAALVTGRA